MSFWNAKLVKTRKESHCAGCQRVFPAGSQMWAESGVVNGDFSSYKFCPICKGYWQEYAQDLDYEFMDGDLFFEGWGRNGDNGEFLGRWLQKNKPLCVEYSGRWRKTEAGYEKIA